MTDEQFDKEQITKDFDDLDNVIEYLTKKWGKKEMIEFLEIVLEELKK